MVTRDISWTLSLIWAKQRRLSAVFLSLRAYLVLTKPAIIGLLLVTSMGGAFMAASGPPAWNVALAVLGGGALTAGGANALNHYLDRDIDGLMTRTRARPIPSNRVPAAKAFTIGIFLHLVGFLILMTGANLFSAVLALTASVFYLLVYTLWLKRRTPQNIVFGGAAGAMAPVVAWTAVTGSLSVPVIYLFTIVFLWTPPHFWALAMLIKDDYQRARIPMLPVVRSQRYTLRAVFVYTVALVAFTILSYPLSGAGLVLLATTIILGASYIWLTWTAMQVGSRRHILRMYKYSLLYLALLFASMMFDRSEVF